MGVIDCAVLRGEQMQTQKLSDDNWLVERGSQGDRDAVDQLIRKHQARAYQYAYRLTRDQDTAADIVSEAFLRVYRSIQGFKGQSAFTTWLYRIITNCYLDSRKRQACRPTTSLDEALETPNGELHRQLVSDDEDPLEIFARRKTAETLSDATDALPDPYRKIVLMYHGEMLSYEEISVSLNIPIGTVKSRLNRARLALGQMLRNRKEELTAV
jgi:RNA polymerase sigma-70 factor (ECF subfamily)